jgi:hypothetical protein
MSDDLGRSNQPFWFNRMPRLIVYGMSVVYLRRLSFATMGT